MRHWDGDLPSAAVASDSIAGVLARLRAALESTEALAGVLGLALPPVRARSIATPELVEAALVRLATSPAGALVTREAWGRVAGAWRAAHEPAGRGK